MKGNVVKVSGRTPSMATPTRVGKGGNVTGVTNKGLNHISKTSSAGGFVASRKKGSVRGSHVA